MVEIPAWTVGGVTPLVSPLLLIGVGFALIGWFLLIGAMMRRNVLLIFRQRLSPFSVRDAGRVMNTDPSQLAGGPGVLRSRSGRIGVILLVAGCLAIGLDRLMALFAG